MSSKNVSLRSELKNAWGGWNIWHQLCKRYQFEENSRIIIQPTPGTLDELSALLYLDDLLLTTGSEKAYFLSPNATIGEVLPLFCSRAEYIQITPGEITSVEAYYRLRTFDQRCIIAALSEPRGRMGEVLIGVNGISAEEIFALGVYRVWDYFERALPEYSGESEEIRAFLVQAHRLQDKNCLLHNREGCYTKT